MVESIGRRIAFLRQKNGWTQQSLSARLAMSRVAISHIEMDLTIPSERSITLMAGLFKLSPHQLVDGTTYPIGKAERLPVVTTTFTELELSYALLQNDLEWLVRIDKSGDKRRCTRQVLEKWHAQIVNYNDSHRDEHECAIILKMKLALQQLNDQSNHQRE
jgi:transcriptional regulator with XRE-family HTH domain